MTQRAAAKTASTCAYARVRGDPKGRLQGVKGEDGQHLRMRECVVTQRVAYKGSRAKTASTCVVRGEGWGMSEIIIVVVVVIIIIIIFIIITLITACGGGGGGGGAGWGRDGVCASRGRARNPCGSQGSP